MPQPECPNCDAAVTVANPQVGDKVVCGNCGERLEVVNDDPIELDFEYDDDYDDDDDGYEYDDDYDDD